MPELTQLGVVGVEPTGGQAVEPVPFTPQLLSSRQGSAVVCSQTVHGSVMPELRVSLGREKLLRPEEDPECRGS